jgi:hypothetical protein
MTAVEALNSTIEEYRIVGDIDAVRMLEGVRNRAKAKAAKAELEALLANARLPWNERV